MDGGEIHPAPSATEGEGWVWRRTGFGTKSDWRETMETKSDWSQKPSSASFRFGSKACHSRLKTKGQHVEKQSLVRSKPGDSSNCLSFPSVLGQSGPERYRLQQARG